MVSPLRGAPATTVLARTDCGSPFTRQKFYADEGSHLGLTAAPGLRQHEFCPGFNRVLASMV
jgi:hypothetical protein